MVRDTPPYEAEGEEEEAEEKNQNNTICLP